MHFLSAESSEAVMNMSCGTYVRCRCRCCIMRPRTHDDVPTGNLGRGLPRAIPRNLELDETGEVWRRGVGTGAVVGLYAFTS
jgi:hypothetical protein